MYIQTHTTSTLYESRDVYTVSVHICIYDIHISLDVLYGILDAI